MASEEKVQETIELLNTGTEIPVEELITNPNKWGELDFREIENDLRTVIGFMEKLKSSNLIILPDKTLQSLNQHLLPVVTSINKIRNFTITQGNAPDLRKTLIGHIPGEIHQLFSAATYIISILGLLDEKDDEPRRAIEELTEKARSDVTGILAEMTKSAEEAQQTLSATKEAAGQAGVGVFTEDFKNEASDFGEAAKRWLIGMAIGVIVTIVVTAIYGFIIPFPSLAEKWPVLLHYTATKFVIIGLLITATLWCGQMYKTSKHQQTINKHRANSLATFQAFVKAALDPSTSDAVLLETTRAIFKMHPTGYVRGGGIGQDETKIIEVMKSAITKGE